MLITTPMAMEFGVYDPPEDPTERRRRLTDNIRQFTRPVRHRGNHRFVGALTPRKAILPSCKFAISKHPDRPCLTPIRNREIGIISGDARAMGTECAQGRDMPRNVGYVVGSTQKLYQLTCERDRARNQFTLSRYRISIRCIQKGTLRPISATTPGSISSSAIRGRMPRTA
jgi:hypothetical protein